MRPEPVQRTTNAHRSTVENMHRDHHRRLRVAVLKPLLVMRLTKTCFVVGELLESAHMEQERDIPDRMLKKFVQRGRRRI
jgi:hypothetical protein